MVFMQNTRDNVLFSAKLGYIGKYFFFPINLQFYLILTNTKAKPWLSVLAYLPAIILNVVNAPGHSMCSNIEAIYYQVTAGFDDMRV